jgi:hypothetical protein
MLVLMWPDYQDIREAAGALEPQWFDGNGVPRYAPFRPEMLGVYDKLALLMQIQCQGCGWTTLVGDGWSQYELVRGTASPVEHTLKGLAQSWSYGDMPRHNRSCAGETMTCTPLAIVQAWEQQDHAWVRRADLEGPLGLPSWAASQSEPPVVRSRAPGLAAP